MPGRGQWPRFGLAIAYHAGDNQIGIVEYRAEGMAERIAQFTTLMDRSGTFRRGMAGYATGKRKLQKQLPQSGLVLADVGIDFTVRAFKIGIGDHGRAAVTRAGHVNHVEVVFFDDPVQMRINKILARGRAPMAQQHMFDIRKLEWPF